jgi:hypothetical protein
MRKTPIHTCFLSYAHLKATRSCKIALENAVTGILEAQCVCLLRDHEWLNIPSIRFPCFIRCVVRSSLFRSICFVPFVSFHLFRSICFVPSRGLSSGFKPHLLHNDSLNAPQLSAHSKARRHHRCAIADCPTVDSVVKPALIH